MGAYEPGSSWLSTVPHAGEVNKWARRNPTAVGDFGVVDGITHPLLHLVPGGCQAKVDIATDRTDIDVIATLGVRAVDAQQIDSVGIHARGVGPMPVGPRRGHRDCDDATCTRTKRFER